MKPRANADILATLAGIVERQQQQIEMLSAIVGHLAGGTAAGTPTVEPISLLTFFEETYRPAKLVARSAKTLNVYRAVIHVLEIFLGRPATLADMTNETVSALLGWGIAKRKNSVATVNCWRAHLLAIWRFALKRKLIHEPPDVDKLKAPKRLPEAWTIEEFGRVLQAAAALRGHIGEVQASAWWTAFLLTIYDTGLRRTAALSLRMVDLDVERRHVVARAEHSKTATDQVFQLSDTTIAALRAIIDPPRELLFDWPYDRYDGTTYTALSRAFRGIVKAAGLPNGSRNGLHKIRRTSASHLANAVPIEHVMHHLGHSSPDMARRHYIDPRIAMPSVRAAELLPHPELPKADGGRQALESLLRLDKLTAGATREALRKANIQQTKLARALGIGKSYLNWCLKTESRPMPKTVEAGIRRYLGDHLAGLAGGAKKE